MPIVLQWLGGLVALVLFLGAVVVYLRGSKDKGTIETLERNNRALTERVEIVEETAERVAREREADARAHAAEKQALTDRVEALEREKTVLEGVANSREAIAALRTEVITVVGALKGSLDEHHAAAMAGLIQLHEDLDGIATSLGSAS